MLLDLTVYNCHICVRSVSVVSSLVRAVASSDTVEPVDSWDRGRKAVAEPQYAELATDQVQHGSTQEF